MIILRDIYKSIDLIVLNFREYVDCGMIVNNVLKLGVKCVFIDMILKKCVVCEDFI